jgi:hypothetical protein
MAKQSRDGRVNKGRVKLRVIEFELDGSDATLQDSIKGILTAIGTRPTFVREPKALPQATLPEEEEIPDETEAEERSEGQQSTRERRPRNFKSPTILEIDTAGPVSLATFCAEKKADATEARKYLVIAGWLKIHRNIAEIGTDHIYTCFRSLGWHPPRDVSQPLRDMKSKQAWFSKGKERGTYAINHVGLGEVDKVPS